MKTREAAVAGRFYPASAEALHDTLKELFRQAKPKKVKNTIAIITPHAGYIFSGTVAASAFNQLDEATKYKNIFLIGTSHHTYLNGASVYYHGEYQIPGTKIKVNEQIAKDLIKKHQVFLFKEEAHVYEHTLEVQLPFLTYKLGTDFKIIPIIIGTENISKIKEIATALKPYFGQKENLFVISTDLSHYPSYQDALKIDRLTINAILSNNPEKFLETLENNKKLTIPNLATSICGWSSVLTLLYLTSELPNIEFHEIDYKNSGDSIYGDKIQVVGYVAIAITKKQNYFELTDSDKKQLLKIARETLEKYIKEGKIPKIEEDKLSDNIKKPLGAFVTLKVDGKLRGCIGRFLPTDPLYKVVQEMTIASATEDTRFLPVSPEEVDKIKIEISVLTPLQKVENPLKEIQIGRDGIYIRKGFRSGTLLPQVAVENNWDTEEFLKYCSKYKAGLDEDGWKEAEVFKYQAIVFEEE